MRFVSYSSLALLSAALTLSLASPALIGTQETAAKSASAPAASPISGQVTFLYCNNLAKASEFYAKLLEKKPSLDLDWVKIYPVTETLSVGLVDSTHGALRPSPSKPVMLSFVVQNRKQVDEWYARLKALGAEVPHAPESMDLKNGRGIYSLSFKDSEGYSLEIFAWSGTPTSIVIPNSTPPAPGNPNSAPTSLLFPDSTPASLVIPTPAPGPVVIPNPFRGEGSAFPIAVVGAGLAPPSGANTATLAS